MKELFVNSSMNLIRHNFPDYNEEQLECIEYGLQGIYMTFSKIIVIFLAAWILGIFKETLILLLFFDGLRLTAFGLHASKSWMCWISSSIVFLLGPVFCLYIEIPLWVLIAVSIFCFINFILYAPADTEKRPIVNKKKRKIYKIITLSVASIYIVSLFFIDNLFLRNVIVLAMVIQMVLIHPLVYKLFKLPYNNYKSYVFSK